MNWLWNNTPKPKASLDNDKSYIKIEFLTSEQKVKKDVALNQLTKDMQQNSGTIFQYEQYYPCSFRMVFNAKQLNSQLSYNQTILLKQIIGHIALSTDEKTKQFWDTQLSKIIYFMQNDEMVKEDSQIKLFDEVQIQISTPKQALEIIYEQKSLWQRVKNKTKATIKNIPSILATVVKKIFSFILVLLGLNGGMSSLIWKAIPMKMVLQWVGMIVSMFFPILGPILGLSKLIL